MSETPPNPHEYRANTVLPALLAIIHDGLVVERDLAAWQLPVAEGSQESQAAVEAGKEAQELVRAHYLLDNRGEV